jgi:hypothetical protein
MCWWAKVISLAIGFFVFSCGVYPNAQAQQQFHDIRLALVIGNSNYANLPKLSNPVNDARSIAEVLQKLGYTTKLLLDASDQSIRSEVRKFANESSKADVALVYYAGHGAQLHGNNYLLPVDIDIPRTEADIQLAGLKVDDLVKSIGSGIKIVFLDACRDNPVFFKNIVSGRGNSPVGLAPTTGSNFTPTKPGGGVFMAYAAEAGSVADEGHGPHSPFTQALLKYVQKPVSIDDMFSLVTREVRLVTKNAQRPYKYASLENIICLTPECSSTLVVAPVDTIQQARQSQDDELQIALQTKNVDALGTYFDKYPEARKSEQLLSQIAALKRSEHTEWTLFEVANQHLPQFMQLSSIQKFGDQSAIRQKQPVDESKPKVFHGRTFPEAAYIEDLNVYDCTGLRMVTADEGIYNQAGNLLFHYKWGDPQYLNLKIGVELTPGSVGFFARNIACNERVSAPLLSKKQIIDVKFDTLVKSPNGDGEIFRYLVPNQETADQKTILIILRWLEDHNIKDTLPQELSIPNPPSYRTEVDHTVLKCDEKKYLIDKIEYWNSSNEIVHIRTQAPSALKFLDFDEKSIYQVLQEIYCGKSYSGLGLRLISDNGSIKVGEVFKGSPAEKAGVKTNDIIAEIDHGSVSGLTVQQVTEKARGPVNSKVVLTISRDGQGSLELTAIRENIQPTELRPSR